MKLTFRSRILVTIALSCLICTSAAILVARGRLQDNGELAVLAKSRAILSRLEVGRDYVAEMGMLDQVIADTVKRHPNGVLTEDDKLRVLKNVPVFAAFKLGQAAAEREHYKFRIASDKPRREENRATPDELRVIDKFKADPQLTEWVESSPDGATISVVRPVRISERQGCLVCHGHPSRSPWENGKDILGYPMENMKDGDLRATFAVVSETAPIRAVVQAATGNIILWGLIFTAVALGIGFLAIRRSLGDLNAVSDRLGVSGVELSNVSSQISSVSQSLSASSTESAASLEQTVSSIEEISSMINRNADSAREAAGLSKAARSAAEKGEVEIKELNSAIREISTSSSKIEEIINVIDDIAFQTNLLALNAAVEAARAGEQGKGFAVVAEAVRNLAQRSAAAAKDITSLIKDSVGKVERGSDLATSSGQALAAIVASVQKMAEITSEIASASTEQAAGINQISKAMNQLDQTTQQNAAASEESAASAEQMAIQASSLQELVKDLTAVIDGVTLEESRAQHSRSVPAQDGLSWSPSATLGRPGEVFPETAMHEPPRKAPVSKAVPPSRNPETAKTGGKKILSSTEDINKDF